jgi:hypothetical protein
MDESGLMSFLSFETKITNGMAAEVHKRIMSELIRRSPEAMRFAGGLIRDIPEVRKLLSFMGSSRFRADFGIGVEDKTRILKETREVFSGINNIFSASKNIVSFSFLPQDKLRETTSALWTNVNLNRVILVNAWDIYEYGIIRRQGQQRRY